MDVGLTTASPATPTNHNDGGLACLVHLPDRVRKGESFVAADGAGWRWEAGDGGLPKG